MVKKLDGYQSNTPETFDRGKTVGHGGEVYDIYDFDPKYITIERIASSLSKQCRYIGNIGGIGTNDIMSVAQHSYYLAMTWLLVGDPIKAKQALYHDAAESVISDISRPLKKELCMQNGDSVSRIESEIESKIMHVLGVKFPFDDDVMVTDKNCAQLEMSVMINKEIFTDYWSPAKAFDNFLEMDRMINHMIGQAIASFEDINALISDDFPIVQWHYNDLDEVPSLLIDKGIVSQDGCLTHKGNIVAQWQYRNRWSESR